MQFQFTSDSGFSSDSSADLLQLNHNLEKVRNLENQVRKITAAKEAFLLKLRIIDKRIEKMMKNLVACAHSSERALKNSLEDVGCAVVLRYTHQIELCKEAVEFMKNADISCVQIIFDAFVKKIGFIDAGEIKFESSNFLLLKELENFGKLTWSNESYSEKLKPKFIIGGKKKEFNGPWGVCSDATGRILVTDRGNNRVQVFDEYGKLLFIFGKLGSGSGEFDSPMGITVDKKWRIIVTDKNNHRVQIFTFTGKFLMRFGQRGRKAGEFKHPRDVAVNGNGDIAVSDVHRIQLFSTHGDFLTEFCFGKSIPYMQLKVRLRGVAFKPDGSLLVIDVSSGCVFLINKNFSISTKIKGLGNFAKPEAVSCNKKGELAISDSERKKIQVFDESGNLCKSIDVQEFGCLLGLYLLPEGGIIAADFKCNRVLMF